MTKPQPRPALQRAADSDVHPVSGRVEKQQEHGSAKRKKSKGATSDAIFASVGKADEKSVELSVRIPKSLRKKLRALAKDRGISSDQMVTDILRVALD